MGVKLVSIISFSFPVSKLLICPNEDKTLISVFAKNF